MSSPPRRGPRLRVESLEDRTVPSFSPFQMTGGESIAVGDVFPEPVGSLPQNEIIIGAGPGQLPYVRVYNPAGTLEAEFLAYEPSFTGGVNVAVGNEVVNPVGGTDYKEIVTGPGFGGGPVVKVFNPSGGSLVRAVLAYEASFRGGVNVAAGNVNPATATDELIVGSGYGGGPVVRVFNADGTAYSSFFAYESSFRNGVTVASADLIPTGTGGANAGFEIATGPGDGGAPLLKVFSGTGVLQRSYFAFDFQNRNGLNVAAGNTDNGPNAQVFASELFTPLTSPIRVRGFNGSSTGQIVSDFTPFPAGYTRYINMAVGDVAVTPNLVTNAPDWVGVAAEGVFNGQVPRVQFGRTGSAAGNNGP